MPIEAPRPERQPGTARTLSVALFLTAAILAGALVLIAWRGPSILLDLAGAVRAICF